MNAGRSIASLGNIAQQLQIPIDPLRKIIAEAGIVPELTINGVSHFGAEDVARIADHIRAKHAPPTGAGMLPGRNLQF